MKIEDFARVQKLVEARNKLVGILEGDGIAECIVNYKAKFDRGYKSTSFNEPFAIEALRSALVNCKGQIERTLFDLGVKV